MHDFWILFLVKVHRWTGRKLRREVMRKTLRMIALAHNTHLN
jgi:hypothetical protein